MKAIKTKKSGWIEKPVFFLTKQKLNQALIWFLPCMIDSFSHRLPQRRPQDPVSDDEVKFLQVGSRPVFQHAVAVETVLAIIEALGDLKCITACFLCVFFFFLLSKGGPPSLPPDVLPPLWSWISSSRSGKPVCVGRCFSSSFQKELSQGEKKQTTLKQNTINDEDVWQK